MNKLYYRKDQKTVYSICGYGSGGMSFQKKDGGDWEEFPRTHTSLNLRRESEIELAEFSAVFFK